MYCSVCKCHHKASMFGASQRKKSAVVRICKDPKPPVVKYKMTFSSYSEFADYCEFGRTRYFATEYAEDDSDYE